MVVFDVNCKLGMDGTLLLISKLHTSATDISQYRFQYQSTVFMTKDDYGDQCLFHESPNANKDFKELLPDHGTLSTFFFHAITMNY